MEDKYVRDIDNNLSFDDYRNQISEIVSRNRKRIKVINILRDCGIDKGNYYAFMKNGGKTINGKIYSSLSLEKLKILLQELQSLDSEAANNRKKLAAMSDKKLAAFIEEKIIGDPDADRIDMYRWLRSSSPEMIYKEDEND